MTRSQSYPAWPGLGSGPGPSSLPAPPSAAAVLPPIPPWTPEPSTGPRGRAAICTTITRAGGSHLPDVLGAGLVHVTPACASHSKFGPQDSQGPCAWLPSRGGVWGALRGQGPPRPRDRPAGDLKMGAQGADAWLRSPGPGPATAGPQWETALGPLTSSQARSSTAACTEGS